MKKLIVEIAIKYKEIFNNELDLIYSSSLIDKENEIIKLKIIIDDSLGTGKINELQYKLLKEKLSNHK